MQWIWLTAAAIIGIIAGYFAGWRVAAVAMRPTLQELNQNLASDRNLALGVLRRELANWMFRHDPDRYLQTYKTAHEATKVISKIDNREQLEELAKLTERHKFYKDFDSIATRDYVLYADALSGNTYDEVEHHYIDIIRFQALQIALNHWGNWDIMPPTNDAELGDPSVAHRREGHQEQPAESPPPVPTQTQGASYPGQTDDPNPNALPRKPDIKAAS
jgi:hypothetical protein